MELEGPTANEQECLKELKSRENVDIEDHVDIQDRLALLSPGSQSTFLTSIDAVDGASSSASNCWAFDQETLTIPLKLEAPCVGPLDTYNFGDLVPPEYDFYVPNLHSPSTAVSGPDCIQFPTLPTPSNIIGRKRCIQWLAEFLSNIYETRFHCANSIC